MKIPSPPTDYHKKNYKVKHFDGTISDTTFPTRFIPLPSSFHKGQNWNNSVMTFLSNHLQVVRWLWEQSATHTTDVKSIGKSQTEGTEDKS